MQRNDKKICFILCVNDEVYVEECKKYIHRLIIPDGYEIDIITIQDAPSMTAGYNAGMNATDAKYKVYLHQDVFILHPHFLEDTIHIFKDRKIGMIGMVGTIKLPECAVPWYSYRTGQLYSCDCKQMIRSDFYTGTDQYVEVEAIDGLLMMTQYDIPWREDIFQGWDYYDVSQSQEFQKVGYKVVVPTMRSPWCIHDDGIVNLRNYYKNRKIYLKEYGR